METLFTTNCFVKLVAQIIMNAADCINNKMSFIEIISIHTVSNFPDNTEFVNNSYCLC